MPLSSTTQQWLQDNNYSADDWSIVDEHGNNAISKAVMRDKTAVAEELLQYPVDINHRNGDGNNALWFACFQDNIAMIDKLVAAGVEIDNQNLAGATCLMYSASASKTEVVDALLKHGADYKLRSQDDYSALDFAGNAAILKRLKALGD